MDACNQQEIIKKVIIIGSSEKDQLIYDFEREEYRLYTSEENKIKNMIRANKVIKYKESALTPICNSEAAEC